MAKITEVLAQITTLLRDDAGIKAILPKLQVWQSYRKDSEVKTSELPCAMILRPSRTTTREVSEVQRKHRIIVIVGIIENDKDVAQDKIYELETLIDDLLENNIPEINSMDAGSDEFQTNRYWLALTYEYSEVR